MYYPKQTRASLRGEPLLKECYKAKLSKHEMGPADMRQFCHGLEDPQYDEAWEPCRTCNAWVHGSKFL